MKYTVRSTSFPPSLAASERATIQAPLRTMASSRIKFLIFTIMLKLKLFISLKVKINLCLPAAAVREIYVLQQQAQTSHKTKEFSEIFPWKPKFLEEREKFVEGL